MRTTVTLDPDVAAFLQRIMRERNLTFKDALNDAVRAGMSGRRERTRLPFPTYEMGEPRLDVTQALRLAGELEDQELLARLRRGA